ncbi:hypothetical protein C5E22_00375 [Pectobacterium parmentieri]|uniref:Uncharacterized protein n=1 Tax=Pectobacterium parmentieri TaxID=1905730 RepID=A0A8B3FGR2_PECPM|nr:hypothetical protein C5E24_00375 [Pectobacterium parmentieri]AYH17048.1 hypothetical protein C5E22_00375 [Pectobacterium parmentieri]AYH34652.1 hypothetical protein C5E17_00375 [Pectobacterium parmentieri]AZS54737.1 hypothetical protein C5E18_00375 [Pectobacterium parmentieri]PWD60697.1 hypothetical protein DF211_16465 [Pectobacterium parmentieri]
MRWYLYESVRYSSHVSEIGYPLSLGTIYPSYFKLIVRWRALLAPITYLSKFLGIRSVAAFTQLELFRV